MGIQSRRHRRNRGERYDRRQEARAFFHTVSHGRDAAIRKLAAEMAADYRGEDHPPTGRARKHRVRRARATGLRATMSGDDLARLAAYNQRHRTDAALVCVLIAFWHRQEARAAGLTA
jgi:hypothetical protein